MNEIEVNAAVPHDSRKTEPVKKESLIESDSLPTATNGQPRINDDDIEELNPEEVASDTDDILEGKEPGRWSFEIFIE